MLNLLLSGCHGRMGRQIAELCCNSVYFRIVAGIDPKARPHRDFPVFSTPGQCPDADVLVDFSVPSALPALLESCSRRRMSAVFGVTGLNSEHLRLLRKAARTTSLFYAANLSLGAAVLQRLARSAAADIGSTCDISIMERHHREKRDSPSGTALLLAGATGCPPARIHSIRAGTVPGEHSILFSGDHETLELVHRSCDRTVYATGALRAAQFIATVRTPGLYGMDDLLP